MPKYLKKFLKFEYIFVFLLLIAAFILRVYRVDKILGFYYDQGRDALVIWDLIHSHKFFLIGPTTGLPGIFRGPYYYYLIAPFYWLGNGNPAWPSVFLSLTTVAATWVIYVLGRRIKGVEAGIFSVVLSSLSFNIINASRWLSNPTPMLLLSALLVWGMVKVVDAKKWGWWIIAVVSGLSLFNFGSSGEFFYFPAIFIFLLWQWKNRPDVKNLIFSIFLFFLTFAPLVFFDFKHGHILLNNLLDTFGVGSGSFGLPNLAFISQRTHEYYDIFVNKIFLYKYNYEIWALVILGLAFLFSLPGLLKNKYAKVVILLLASPIVGLYFYKGNYGVLYDYYMTGYYLIALLLVGIVLATVWKYKLGKLFVVGFLLLFLQNNIPVLESRLNDGCDGPESICLLNQEQSINWIYENSGNRDFNVDEYVPPVIPYAYDYLFKWLGVAKYHKLPNENRVNLLYTLYEVDPSHPERLDAWLARQKGIGKVIKEQSFGGITVQERIRIK